MTSSDRFPVGVADAAAAAVVVIAVSREQQRD